MGSPQWYLVRDFATFSHGGGSHAVTPPRENLTQMGEASRPRKSRDLAALIISSAAAARHEASNAPLGALCRRAPLGAGRALRRAMELASPAAWVGSFSARRRFAGHRERRCQGEKPFGRHDGSLLSSGNSGGGRLEAHTPAAARGQRPGANGVQAAGARPQAA